LNGNIKHWSLSGLECLETIKVAKAVCVAHLNSDFILVGDAYCNIKTYDVKTGDLVKKTETVSTRCCTVLNQRYFVFGNNDGSITMWKNINHPKYTLFAHLSAVTCLAVLNDEYFASGSEDANIGIWKISGPKCIKKLKGHQGSVICLAVMKENRLASCGSDSIIYIWNYLSGEWVLRCFSPKTSCLTVLRNGWLAAGTAYSTINVWDVDQNRLIGTLYGHKSTVTCLTGLNDHLLISGSCDKTIRIWNIYTGDCVTSLKGHDEEIVSLICS
jgi:WD40 repeat protein